MKLSNMLAIHGTVMFHHWGFLHILPCKRQHPQPDPADPRALFKKKPGRCKKNRMRWK